MSVYPGPVAIEMNPTANFIQMEFNPRSINEYEFDFS